MVSEIHISGEAQRIHNTRHLKFSRSLTVTNSARSNGRTELVQAEFRFFKSPRVTNFSRSNSRTHGFRSKSHNSTFKGGIEIYKAVSKERAI
jgi:hypothetical protein